VLVEERIAGDSLVAGRTIAEVPRVAQHGCDRRPARRRVIRCRRTSVSPRSTRRTTGSASCTTCRTATSRLPGAQSGAPV